MGKRSNSKGRRHRRSGSRRRTSGIGSAGAGMNFGAALLALGAGIITRFLASILRIDVRITGGATLLLGGALVFVRNPLVQAAGFGTLVSGGITLSQGFGLIRGVGAPIIYRRDGQSVRGPNDVKNLGTAGAKRYPQPGNIGKSRRSAYSGIYG